MISSPPNLNLLSSPIPTSARLTRIFEHLNLHSDYAGQPRTPVMVYKEWCTSVKQCWMGDQNHNLWTPIHIMITTPTAEEATPSVVKSTWTATQELTFGLTKYKGLLEDMDKKLPDYYGSIIQSGTLGVTPVGDYEPGIIGRKCTMPSFATDSLEESAQNPATTKHQVRIIKGVPSNFWTIPSPFHSPFDSSSIDPPTTTNQQHSSYVSTAPIRKATNCINYTDNSLPRGQYEVNQIVSHKKKNATYTFVVELKVNREMKRVEVPFVKVKNCSKLREYVNSSSEEMLKRFYNSKHIQVSFVTS